MSEANAVVWRELLEVARWAPSPHNTQPWVLRPIDSRRAEVLMVSRRRLPDEDTTGCFLICAMGIFIEALRIAAANRGRGLEVQSRPELDYQRDFIPFAEITLTDSAQPDEFSDRSLTERRTSRLPSMAEPLSPDAEVRMAAIAERFGHGLRIVSEPKLVFDILRANADAVMHDLSDRTYGGEIKKWYRYTATQAARTKDGLDARCMNIPALEMWLSAAFPWLIRTPGLSRVMNRTYLRRVGVTHRIMVLSGPFFSRESAERSGTMLLRLWLALHEAGGSLHPFGNLVTNTNAHQWLTRRVGEHNIWLVARFGRTAPPPQSCRLDVGEIIHD